MSSVQAKRKDNTGLKMLLIVLIAAMWIVSLFMLMLLVAPQTPSVPTFEINDKNGSWEAQGTVGVFDNSIKPGSAGEYNFIITSASDAELKYTFSIEEHFEGKDNNWTPFIQYRLRMNGQLIGGDDWFYADYLFYSDIIILANTKQLLTLEWRWDFDGDDDYDTTLGIGGGEYYVTFYLKAEVV